MKGRPQLRYAARVLLLDEREKLLLFRGHRPETGAPFWLAPGGGLEKGEDARAAAVREVAEETGLTDFVLGPEIWRRRHIFTWRGVAWDQRERWFMARVAHFEPDGAAMSETEKTELTAARWWALAELETTTETLAPLDLALRLGSLLSEGAPTSPIDVGA
jgi:8-oxo-dGTP pyrophosphatase MutT (NUDIX family)